MFLETNIILTFHTTDITDVQILHMGWGIKMTSLFYIFLYFNRGEGCVTRVVPLAPGPCDDAGDICMFP